MERNPVCVVSADANSVSPVTTELRGSRNGSPGAEVHIMNLKKHLGMILTVAVTALVFTCVGAYAATNYGSQSDPLVTVSYLT